MTLTPRLFDSRLGFAFCPAINGLAEATRLLVLMSPSTGSDPNASGQSGEDSSGVSEREDFQPLAEPCSWRGLAENGHPRTPCRLVMPQLPRIPLTYAVPASTQRDGGTP